MKEAGITHLLQPTRTWQRPLMTAIEEEALERHYRKLLDQAPPDVVISYGGMLLERSLLAEARSRGIRTVFNLVNPNYRDRHVFKHADVIITNTQATADLYKKRLGLEAHPIGALLDTDALLVGRHQPRYITFINPGLEKGAGMVARLALMCQQRLPDVQFLVIESRGNWEQSLRQLGLAETLFPNVTVWPSQHDIRKVYKQTRLLLAPSFWHESGGRVAVEAMVNGIPPIAASHGGFAEWTNGGGVLLDIPAKARENFAAAITEADAAPWFDAIEALWTDPFAYAQAATKAREAARQYDLQASVRRFLAVLDSVV